ncbi:MAG: 2-C-methyl-D-erythritol 4-phosphate cytidylyltransferase, partial [Enterobacterales bacterium]|nr:2-C-methyl-D-erythritol 4-phosphate cytidylyltransferase [Enterobacterales bacterium]
MSDPDVSTLLSIVAVVPAAGVGSRMRSAFPKQYLTIAGKT